MERKLNVIYITNIPSPYRVDFFNELGKLCNLTVLFERKEAKGRDKTWGQYTEEFFETVELSSDSAFSIQVVKYLDKTKYDVIVVGGYSTPTAMIAILYMKMRKIPFLLNADGGMVKKDKHVIRFIKKYFIGSASGFLSTGEKTDEYLMHYGAKKEKIYRYPFTSVRASSILTSAPTCQEKKQIKKELNIDADKVLISVGQFIYRKGFDVLIRSMKDVRDAVLYIIGGEPTQEYDNLIKAFSVDNVFFLPFLKQEDLFNYYCAADIFVLPTREDIWGLVVNEAMSQGLPVITTNRCVAGLELVFDGFNGYIVPIEDALSLAQKINMLLCNEPMRAQMADESLNVIRGYSIEEMARRHIEVFQMHTTREI